MKMVLNRFRDLRGMIFFRNFALILKNSLNLE
jgi:hypothetical protein